MADAADEVSYEAIEFGFARNLEQLACKFEDLGLAENATVRMVMEALAAVKPMVSHFGRSNLGVVPEMAVVVMMSLVPVKSVASRLGRRSGLRLRTEMAVVVMMSLVPVKPMASRLGRRSSLRLRTEMAVVVMMSLVPGKPMASRLGRRSSLRLRTEMAVMVMMAVMVTVPFSPVRCMVSRFERRRLGFGPEPGL